MGVVSDDPHSWGLLTSRSAPNARKARLRDGSGIWIATYYIAFSDSTYRYLRRPRYVQIRTRDADIAIMVCAGDEDGAITVQDPIGEQGRAFFHIILPRMTWRGRFRTGRYPHRTQHRMIGTEPYIALDNVWLGFKPAADT